MNRQNLKRLCQKGRVKIRAERTGLLMPLKVKQGASLQLSHSVHLKLQTKEKEGNPP